MLDKQIIRVLENRVALVNARMPFNCGVSGERVATKRRRQGEREKNPGDEDCTDAKRDHVLNRRKGTKNRIRSGGCDSEG